MLVTVLATKHMYEKGSAESRRPPKNFLGPVVERLRDHSLSIFLLVTGIGWAIFYAHLNSESKWGEVVGNIVSEWTQILGLVLLTKKLIESGTLKKARINTLWTCLYHKCVLSADYVASRLPCWCWPEPLLLRRRQAIPPQAGTFAPICGT